MKKTGHLLLVPVAAVVVILLFVQNTRNSAENSLEKRIEKIQRANSQPEISCSELAAAHPLVLLALGQSNAGNHGHLESRSPTVNIIADQRCVLAHDPLPGATGEGGSIWSHLAPLLTAPLGTSPVVLSVLAVDSTTIAEWTDRSGPLKSILTAKLASMNQLGLPPTLILWQQGEADARDYTSEEDYMAHLQELASILDDEGVHAPIILAKSTVCRSSRYDKLHTAIEKTVAQFPRFQRGPDTDALDGDQISEGCHLRQAGLKSAARMWAASVSRALKTLGSPPLSPLKP